MKTLNRTMHTRERSAEADAFVDTGGAAELSAADRALLDDAAREATTARVSLSGGPEAAVSAPNGAETISRAFRRLAARAGARRR
jgi:hypothetical protein